MKKLLFILFLVVGTVSVFGQSNGLPCITCDGNRIDFTKGASAIGTRNVSSGVNSFASGYINEATGNYSFAAGYESKAFGNQSIALGKNALASGIQSFALGLLSEAAGSASLAIGAYTKTSQNAIMAIALGSKVTSVAERSMTIGYGLYDTPIENNISNSMMIGFNSDRPTLFLGASSGLGKTGRVGIGNITAPTAKLHIRADNNEDAAIMLQPTGSTYSAKIFLGDNDHSISAKANSNLTFTTSNNNYFAFMNGRVGIGTNTPTQTLDVQGTLRVASLSSTITKMLVTTADGTLATTDIPADDNMGNHTATQNINLNGKYLSGDGSNEGVFVNSAGKVGIGISTPSQTLDVEGTMRVSALASATQKMLVTTADGTLATTDIPADDNLGNHTATQNINLNGKYLSGDGDAEGIYISNQGKIGIGTYAPAAQIEVYGGVNNVVGRFKSVYSSLNIGHAISDDGLGVWGSTYIGFNLRRDADNQWKTEWDGASNGAAMIFGTSGGDLIFTCISTNPAIPGIQQLNNLKIKDNAKMILRSDGLLKVNEVVVKTNVWSDYVFRDDYALPELAEVEEFITKNHHLPDVPSEAEVLEEGINLGQMDALLLKKIEELTLHIIKQQKEIDALKQAFKESKEPAGVSGAIQQLPEEPKK